MVTTPVRLSPLHDAIEELHPTWGALDEMPVALHFGDAAAEKAQAAKLGLCDASAMPRTMLKGPGALDMLRGNRTSIPEKIFDIVPISATGFLARTGSTEFFIEDLPGSELLAHLSSVAAVRPGSVADVLRQDASILLSGTDAVDVLRETCNYEFHLPAADGATSNGQQRSWMVPAAASHTGVVFTRIVGVSVMVLPRILNGVPVFQLWLDGTYGMYLWETLLEIVREHGGQPVGLATFYPSAF